MIQAVSGAVASLDRKTGKSGGSGRTQWRTNFIGRRVEQVADEPQAFLVDMDVNSIIVPHFHQTNQFQVMVAGHGTLGRNAAPLIALHYVDHHTAYGPIN